MSSGGSVLTTLIESSQPLIKECEFTALVRKESYVDALRGQGVNAVKFSGLDDLDLVREVTAHHDVVINAASTFHSAVAKAIIDGLRDRKKATGQQTHLIQVRPYSHSARQP